MLMLTWPIAGGVTSVRNDDASWTRAVRVKGTGTGANACRPSAVPRYVRAEPSSATATQPGRACCSVLAMSTVASWMARTWAATVLPATVITVAVAVAPEEAAPRSRSGLLMDDAPSSQPPQPRRDRRHG